MPPRVKDPAARDRLRAQKALSMQRARARQAAAAGRALQSSRGRPRKHLENAVHAASAAVVARVDQRHDATDKKLDALAVALGIDCETVPQLLARRRLLDGQLRQRREQDLSEKQSKKAAAKDVATAAGAKRAPSQTAARDVVTPAAKRVRTADAEDGQAAAGSDARPSTRSRAAGSETVSTPGPGAADAEEATRRSERPSVDDAASSAKGQSRRPYRKGGVTEELTVGSFPTFFLAMASEVGVRTGGATCNGPAQQLPQRARDRFHTKRRCTFSWMTDRTSLALAARLRTLRAAEALRAIILGQTVFTRTEAFEALSDATKGLDAASVKKLVEEHQLCEASQHRRPARKSTISPALQSGSLGRLPPGPTGRSVNDRVAAFVAKLNLSVDAAWSRIAAGENAVDVLVDRGVVHLPKFRAQCVARWLWLLSRGAHGEPPDSLGLGDGARDALLKLAGGDTEDDFRRLLPKLRAAVRAADVGRVRRQLRRLGLYPDAAQTYEHLLREAGKVFGTGRRNGRGIPRPGYEEAFEAALPFYQRCVAK